MKSIPLFCYPLSYWLLDIVYDSWIIASIVDNFRIFVLGALFAQLILFFIFFTVCLQMYQNITTTITILKASPSLFLIYLSYIYGLCFMLRFKSNQIRCEMKDERWESEWESN